MKLVLALVKYSFLFFYSTKKPIMVWNASHNDIFVREMYLAEPWQHKKGSCERGSAWDQISESLNNHENPRFNVNQKAVRDHNYLEREYKKKVREEERASGISPQNSDLDDAVGDIIERFEAKDEEDRTEDSAKKGKVEAEAAKAVEMRKAALKTFSQSKKRKGEQVVKKSKRATGSETVAYLKEKSELNADLKKEELLLRQRELDERKAQQDSFLAQQESFTKMLTQSMANQQKQQEQLMQQMQLQNSALISLLQGMSKDK